MKNSGTGFTLRVTQGSVVLRLAGHQLTLGNGKCRVLEPNTAVQVQRNSACTLAVARFVVVTATRGAGPRTSIKSVHPGCDHIAKGERHYRIATGTHSSRIRTARIAI